jgi:hypothetical protein
MQKLDKELHHHLQAQHQIKDKGESKLPLTDEILERYEELIQAQCTLRQIVEHDLPFQWPFKRAASQKSDSIASPPPFDWLEKQSPKTAEKALEVIDKTIHEVHKLYLWDFDRVRKEWISKQKDKEAQKLRRPLVNKFRATLTQKRKGFPGVFYLILLPFLVGFLTIPFLSSDQYRAGISKTLVPPPTSQHYWLSDSEMQLFDEWYKVSKSSRNSYVDAFVLVSRDRLKQIGMKLIRQGNLWNKNGDFSKAQNRLIWASQIGIALQRAAHDEELIAIVSNPDLLPGEPTTVK